MFPPVLMPHGLHESPHTPALALLLFAAGALMSLEAGQFGFSLDGVSVSLVMWILVLAASMLQLSLSALLLLPLAALMLGAAAAAEARAILSSWETGPVLHALLKMLPVPLFFLLFCRGMGQGMALRSVLREAGLLHRRELLLSLVIMIAAILLFCRFAL